MTENRTMRFRDADWFKFIEANEFDITIGGLGSIGSWLALFLSRKLVASKHGLHVYEYDAVEDTNLAGQFFGVNQVGLAKAYATKQNIHRYTDEDFSFVEQGKALKQYNPVEPVTFVGFDNMQARKDLFDSWVEDFNDTIITPCVFIDGRMDFNSYQIYVVLPTEEAIADYRKTLFDDDDTVPPPCTLKVNTDIAAQLASKMSEFFSIYLQVIACKEIYNLLPKSYIYAGTLHKTEYYDDRTIEQLTSS